MCNWTGSPIVTRINFPAVNVNVLPWRVRSRIEPGRYPGGMPACGAIAGFIARCDEQGVWHQLPTADGGIRGQLVPVVDEVE